MSNSLHEHKVLLLGVNKIMNLDEFILLMKLIQFFGENRFFHILFKHLAGKLNNVSGKYTLCGLLIV